MSLGWGVLIGLLVAGVLAGFLFSRSAGGLEIGTGSPMIVMGVVFFLLILMIALKFKNR